MLQNFIAIFIVVLAAIYLYRKFVPRRKKVLPSHLSSSKSSSCGCGSSCPISKSKMNGSRE